MVDRDPWEGLSDSARLHLLRCARYLADGFSGTLRLECQDGGVRHTHVSFHHSTKDLRRTDLDAA